MINLAMAGMVAFLVSLLGMPVLIRWLAARGIGQPIRAELSAGQQLKKGTPTMGGIMIVVGALTGYLIPHLRSGLPFSWGGICVVWAFVGAGTIGLADDWIKVTRKRSLGLNKRAKSLGQLFVASVFMVGALRKTDLEPIIGFVRQDSPGWKIPLAVFCVFCGLVVLGCSNAVNLTDGMDGLAAGTSVYAFGAYTLMCFWMFRNPSVYRIDQALDLAVIASAMVGACLGFWWWNAAPARIFMGDVGSLAIGAAFGALAVMTYTQLLLVIIGGLFVVETLSVIIQVTSFHLFNKKRVFRMAPIHHHFELKGWPETTVTIRFWIIAMIFVFSGLGFFFADFISLPVAERGVGLLSRTTP
jgi:phospho-N-acetylmuramoyl-pentapeptide-transferase